MTNGQIGTYQIVEAISINPKLKVMNKDDSVLVKINGETYEGNLKVIEAAIDCSKVYWVDELQNNLVEPQKSALDMLSDAFGVIKDEDWEIIYDPAEVWTKCQRLANKKEKKTKSKFELDDDTRSL